MLVFKDTGWRVADKGGNLSIQMMREKAMVPVQNPDAWHVFSKRRPHLKLICLVIFILLVLFIDLATGKKPGSCRVEVRWVYSRTSARILAHTALAPPYLIFTEAESRRSRGGVGSASIITFSQSPSLTSLPQRTSQLTTQKENIKMSQSIASYGLCELRHSTPRPAVTGSYHLAIVERMLSNASFLFFPQRSRHMNFSR